MSSEKQKKIVVLGGSFNPPTIAHMILMQSALDALPADLGVFVPSSEAYVARKMRRQKSEMIFSEERRLRLLKAMCTEDSRLAVSDCEYGDDGRGHSYDTMRKIQKEYPGSELYFLIGSDKLHIITRWRSHDDFFRDFHFVVTARRGQTPEKIIRKNSILNAHADRFHIIPEPEGISGISSTLLREWLESGNPAAKNLVTPAVWAAMQEIYMEDGRSG